MNDLVTLGIEKLSDDQQAFLVNRADYPSDQACCLALGMNKDTAVMWRRKSLYFREAYASLAMEWLSATKAHISILAEEAANVLAEVLFYEAKDHIEVKGVNLRLRAAELILKANGMMDNIQINAGNIIGFTADDLLKARLTAERANRP